MKNKSVQIPISLVLSMLLVVVALIQSSTAVFADHTPPPTSVAIAGSLQDELGCPGDWQPECAATDLTLDASDDVWQGEFTIPTGSWEYKAALNDTWDESYPAANIALNLGADTDVKVLL